MKNLIIGVVVVAMIGGGIYYFTKNSADKTEVTKTEDKAPLPESNATSIETQTVIGKSVEGRDIIAYRFGTNQPVSELLFVGGIHGGYEWNTVLVAYELIDYLKENPQLPAQTGVNITVIPVLNPDGLNKTVGTSGRFSAASVPVSTELQVAGRFNANKVDLNRNFDCDWQANGKWQNKTVSGGSRAFSEPESLAIKNYVEKNKPTAVVVWYSSAGGVFASSCHNGVSSETNSLTKAFADASGYPAHQDFNFYEITGDMVNWLAKINVPAISVLLTNHTDIEWSKNQKGIEAIISRYAKQ